MNSPQISKEKNLEKYSNIVAHKIHNGFKLVETNESLPYSVLFKEGKEVNDNLNFFLFCATFGLWTVPWIYMKQVSCKPQKIVVGIDEDGEPFEEKCYIEKN